MPRVVAGDGGLGLTVADGPQIKQCKCVIGRRDASSTPAEAEWVRFDRARAIRRSSVGARTASPRELPPGDDSWHGRAPWRAYPTA